MASHELPNSSVTSSNRIIAFIQWHYSTTSNNRTPEQIERDRYLYGNVPFNRWLLMPSALVIQFCCGSLYAWSVFNRMIDTHVNNDPDAGLAPITFSIAVGMFGLSSATMGPWLERNGPRKGALLSASLFYLGNLIAAMAIHFKQMWLLYIGYGIIGGFGLGLGYISPVSSLQKWFPDRRGLAAGFAVCGFGAGSIAIAKIPQPLKEVVGLPLTFVILGSCYFVCMGLAASVIRVPPPGYVVESTKTTEVTQGEKVESVKVTMQEQPTIKLTLIESIKSRDFILMYITFFSNAVFGLVVMSRLADMLTNLFGKSPEDASTIVSINGGFNLFGRIFFSTISDYVGRKNCYLFMLTSQTIILIAFKSIITSNTYWAFLLCMWILTACYGGGFGVIPAFLTDMYGASNIGACHGIILTAWSIAGVGGGLVFTAVFQPLKDTYGPKSVIPYITNIYWILAFVALGLLVCCTVRVTIRDRLFPAVPGQIFRFRAFGRLVRLVKGPNGIKFEKCSREQEDAEWAAFLAQRNSD
ncbi:MFS general substrate transporter [Basidiobolus meristosporus CBS 931.73]|uniref:MFS general substrate transporter n=1 Tax=Basidiobolus meristosporus CBS 931.73 TaxID=1314790 RepID=A0A1Y1XY69_9FUNG|nr:MFS general substrate transporter [Basidiobolus meristosporus CBS 931.73]ORY01387.1 MFS general substrate transporter [Basidiobolus meristosporus CBS 931.73]|eukprot:ORX90693.1 MFS general substrate transporter [Basidiobolus meristosporus CBS 931.73]